MRILILNNEFPPLGGGQGVVNEALLRAWENESDVEFDVVIGTCDGSLPKEEQLTRNARLHRIRLFNKNIHHSSNADLLRYLFIGGQVAHQLCMKNTYNLCLAFSAVPAGGIALALKLRFGIPYITRSPGVDIPGFEARYRWLYPLLSPIVRLIWRNAKTNIASSSFHHELMRKLEQNAKFEVLPNAVDTTAFAPSTTSHERLVVVCVARLVKRKGIDILLNAFAKLSSDIPRASLHLVGTGDDENTLKQLAQDLGIAERVKFLGALAHEKMPELYRTADVFVLPSWNEGMSNAALEALASGLPIIMSNVGGASEIISEGTNGYSVPVGDVDALSTKLRAVLTNYELREKMAQASRKRAEEFQWAVIARRYMDVLRS